MKLTNIVIEEFGFEVSAESNGKSEVFCVQLTDGKYRSDLGCWITTTESSEDIESDDYPDFDICAIIDAAESHYKKEFKNTFFEETVDFNCAIDCCQVLTRETLESGKVELVIKDDGYIGSYQRKYVETGVVFDSKDDALEFADKFRTGEFQDCRGLYALMQEIQNH